MRKLVTIRQIKEILPIENADRIELARIDGWQCVVNKGEFQVGDVGLYYEIDSFLSASDSRYAFLEKRFTTWNNKRGARIKTMKLRGQLSQGLLLPITEFPETREYAAKILLGEVDVATSGGIYEHDFAEELGVEKWERILPPNLAGRARGNFPSFIPKTDEERVQNLPFVLSKYENEEFEETIKLDGSSCTMYYLPPKNEYLNEEHLEIGRFGVCSRNLDLVETEGNAFWEVARKLGVEEKLKLMSSSYCDDNALAIQGELIGPTIQSNYERMFFNDFFVFKVFNITTQQMLSPSERRDFCMKAGLKHVPVLREKVVLSKVFKDIPDIIAYADGPGMNPGVKREGVVFKHHNSPFSFKSISNSYLLNEKD